MSREPKVLFTLISTRTGSRSEVELWEGYGVVIPGSCTTNGSCETAAQYCCGHVQAGTYTIEPAAITPDMSSEQALKDQLVKLARGTRVFNAKHKYELGTVVEVDVSVCSSSDGGIEVDLKGTCRLAVVGHILGSEPLYILSDLAVKYPMSCIDYTPETPSREVSRSAEFEYGFVATVVEFGYAEEDLRPTGVVLPLQETLGQWLDAQHQVI